MGNFDFSKVPEAKVKQTKKTSKIPVFDLPNNLIKEGSDLIKAKQLSAEIKMLEKSELNVLLKCRAVWYKEALAGRIHKSINFFNKKLDSVIQIQFKEAWKKLTKQEDIDSARETFGDKNFEKMVTKKETLSTDKDKFAIAFNAFVKEKKVNKTLSKEIFNFLAENFELSTQYEFNKEVVNYKSIIESARTKKAAEKIIGTIANKPSIKIV